MNEKDQLRSVLYHEYKMFENMYDFSKNAYFRDRMIKINDKLIELEFNTDKQ